MAARPTDRYFGSKSRGDAVKVHSIRNSNQFQIVRRKDFPFRVLHFQSGGFLEKEQKYAIRKGHNDSKTGVPIECLRNCSRNGLELANPSSPSRFDARTIRQQYLQLRTYNSK